MTGWCGWGNDDAWLFYQIFTWTPSIVPTQVSDDEVGAHSPVVSGDRISWVSGGKVVFTWTQASGPVGVSVIEDAGSSLGLCASGNRLACEMRWPGLHMDLGGGLRRVDQRPRLRPEPDLSGDRIIYNSWVDDAYQLFTWTPVGGAVQITTGNGRSLPDYRVSGDRIV